MRYYDLIVQLALQDEDYLEVCSAYQEVWDTEEIKEDEARELNVSRELSFKNADGTGQDRADHGVSLRTLLRGSLFDY